MKNKESNVLFKKKIGNNYTSVSERLEYLDAQDIRTDCITVSKKRYSIFIKNKRKQRKVKKVMFFLMGTFECI